VILASIPIAIPVVLSGCSPSFGPGTTAEPNPVASKLLERPVVIGASASAGFNIPTGPETPAMTLARVLDGILADASREPTADLSNVLFFFGAERAGRRAVEEALLLDPTLVFALDFLFWYGYGLKGERARIDDLREGMALLDRFECPVLVSSFPDMRAAIGKMLLPSQVPEPATIDELNRELESWVAARDDVVLVPLVEFLDSVRNGEPVRIGGTDWRPGSKEMLLQTDDLHPTGTGLVVLTQLALEAASRAIDGFDASPMLRVDAADLAEALASGDARAGSR
jgi:hypothetical protein